MSATCDDCGELTKHPRPMPSVSKDWTVCPHCADRRKRGSCAKCGSAIAVDGRCPACRHVCTATREMPPGCTCRPGASVCPRAEADVLLVTMLFDRNQKLQAEVRALVCRLAELEHSGVTRDDDAILATIGPRPGVPRHDIGDVGRRA